MCVHVRIYVCMCVTRAGEGEEARHVRQIGGGRCDTCRSLVGGGVIRAAFWWTTVRHGADWLGEVRHVQQIGGAER